MPDTLVEIAKCDGHTFAIIRNDTPAHRMKALKVLVYWRDNPDIPFTDDDAIDFSRGVMGAPPRSQR